LILFGQGTARTLDVLLLGVRPFAKEAILAVLGEPRCTALADTHPISATKRDVEKLDLGDT